MFDIEYLCGGKSFAIHECEYAKECNDKIDFTIIEDIVFGRYGYCERIGKKCIRDDRRVNMSEAVREMTREELIAERDKYRAEADRQYQNKCKLECQIKEMQSHINCLKAELEEIQMNKQELPDEPINVAEMLISTTGAYTNLFGKEETYNVYDKSDLRQIAEHLLVYCNHA